MYFPNSLLWLLIFVFSVFSQHDDAIAEQSPEDQIEDEGAIFEETIEDRLFDFLEAKGWRLGKNIEGNGQSFLLAMGKAAVLASPSAKTFIASRQNAFDRAMLNAKQEMVEFLRQEIKAGIINLYSQPSDQREDARVEQLMREGMALESAKKVATAAGQHSPPDMLNTVHALSVAGEILVRSEINRELTKQGVDLSRPVQGQEVESVLTSMQFQGSLENIAKERLAGVIAYKTFERVQGDKQGETAVLIVYSDRLHGAANALFSGDTNLIPSGKRKTPLAEQMPKTTAGLMSTFGAQIRTDGKGQLVVIAYAQQGPRTKSSSSMNKAKIRALQTAMAQVRFLAAEIVATRETATHSKTVQEYNDGMSEYQLDDSYREKVEETARSLEIKGITILKRWQGEHPLTKQPIAGVVVAWSPLEAGLTARRHDK